MIYVGASGNFHGQQPFENVLEEVLEDVFRLSFPTAILSAVQV